MTISKDDLPDDWDILPSDHARGFEKELQLELSPVHRLYGVPLQAIARRAWNDDALFRHTGDADRWSVVHLTWTGKSEQPGWPAAAFTGTLAEFRAACPSAG